MNNRSQILDENYIRENKYIIKDINNLLKNIKQERNVDTKEIEDRNNSPALIKKKYKSIINEAFTSITTDYDVLFDVAYIIIEDFNITPESFIMCLDKDNRQKLKNYAEDNCNVDYYKKKEKEKQQRRIENNKNVLKSIDNNCEDILGFFKHV